MNKSKIGERLQFAVLSFEFGHVGQPFFVGLSGFEPAFEEVVPIFRPWRDGGRLFFARMRASVPTASSTAPLFAVPIQCCGNAPLPVVLYAVRRFSAIRALSASSGSGRSLVVVVKAAFGQVCDVQQVFERVLRPQCLDGLALSFWSAFG